MTALFRNPRSAHILGCTSLVFCVCGAIQVEAQQVILSVDFESDTPDTFPDSADWYARSCVPFLENCLADPARIVVTGGSFPDPFAPGNQSVILHNPNSGTQMAISWTHAFEDDPSTFKNGTIEFDLWMDKPVPASGLGAKFWSFLETRIGYGNADRFGAPSTVGDITIWDNIRIQNVSGQPEPQENIVDAGGLQSSMEIQSTYYDPVPGGLMAPDQSFHVEIEISHTAQDGGSYVFKVNDTPIVWPETQRTSLPWVTGAPGVNMLGFLTDGSAFTSGGAGNVYFDNLVVTNNDLSPGLEGDYNNDGKVDAADYVIWRKGGPLQNEVDTPGTVNEADYTAWRARFGNSSGPGFAAGVPEPASLVMLLLALALANPGRRRRGIVF